MALGDLENTQGDERVGVPAGLAVAGIEEVGGSPAISQSEAGLDPPPHRTRIIAIAELVTREYGGLPVPSPAQHC